MATRRYMINEGEVLKDVTQAVGAAVATKNCEFTVDLAAAMTKKDVLQALEYLGNYITQNNWPPAP